MRGGCYLLKHYRTKTNLTALLRSETNVELDYVYRLSADATHDKHDSCIAAKSF